MDWKDLSRDNFASAQKLRDDGDPRFWRSSVNRSYYAAYCAAAMHLCTPGRRFPHGRNNPDHGQLATLIGALSSIPVSDRRKVQHQLRSLREARTTADYRPGRTITQYDSIAAVKSAAVVLILLGIQ